LSWGYGSVALLKFSLLLGRPCLPAGPTPKISLPLHDLVRASTVGSPPWNGLSVAHSRIRSRVFSTPQRFPHARMSRPYFVPQPCLGFSPSEVSPLRSRAFLSEPLAPWQLFPGPSWWDRPSLVTVGFKQPPIPSRRPLLQEAPPGNPPPPEGLGAPPEASPKRLLSGECCYPPPTMDLLFSSLSAALRRRQTGLPVRPGLGRPESPLGSASLCCEALFLLRVRSNEG